MIHLITHGERNNGVNPGHTIEGIAQINALRLPEGITQVVIGTGLRFREIYEAVSSQLFPVRGAVRYSPFCGSADALDPDRCVVLADGTRVPLDHYLGVGTVPGFDAWAFVSAMPDNCLLCAGNELLIALGAKAIAARGQLYEIYPNSKFIRRIS
jgi:hypothetical protein